ncbi:MAG: hypothetical protein NC412_07975 [Roseburia sp.]|nr:hypothetical protein [Roseburia sp.]MCM1278642.1 hypothetical protein [Robinsoniella sp.]
MTMLFHLRIIFGIMAVLFLLLSIILFIKFDIKTYFFIYIKHDSKGYAASRLQEKSTKKKKKKDTKAQLSEQTEKLSEETVLLTEDQEETVVLSEEQLQFVTMKSVEIYSDQQ